MSSVNKPQPTEKWIKASILGTTWASSEIVLGSFLHNLRIPFSGNILTAIGLVILISSSYIWKERGLFWRSGVICAILKTMSPSAVIFGPMIAIFAESLLLESAVRIFGRNVIGFVVGSIMAMSWILFQRIANYIIFYGSNIVDLYQNLMQFAARQFNWEFDAVWAPILLLLFAYSVLGIISTLIGIKTGKNIRDKKITGIGQSTKAPFYNSFGNKGRPFNYSSYWLLANVALLFATLILANKFPLGYWAGLVVAVVAAWAIRYKRALRQLMRPKFWIFFFVITMLTAFVFSGIPSDVSGISGGLVIGVKMNMRAIVLIMGFTVLGTELYNPRIRDFFHNSYFKQVSMSLELSLESLPAMIAQIPDLKSIVKNPVIFISQVILQAEKHLENIHLKKTGVFILSGPIGQGKTSIAMQLAEKLKSESKSAGGIVSPKVMEGGNIVGYDVLNISNGSRKPFLRINTVNELPAIGRFSILPGGLQFGNETLMESAVSNPGLIIIDEVGKLELSGAGWAPSIEKILSSKGNTVVMVVRDEFVEEVVAKWNISPVEYFSASDDAIFRITSYLKEA